MGKFDPLDKTHSNINPLSNVLAIMWQNPHKTGLLYRVDTEDFSAMYCAVYSAVSKLSRSQGSYRGHQSDSGGYFILYTLQQKLYNLHSTQYGEHLML